MPLDAQEILIAGTATISVAPAGTPMPESLGDALDAAFIDVGYTSEDGVVFADSKNVSGFRPHQSFYEVRRWVVSRASEARWTMAQWNTDNLIFAFGGGEVTEPVNNEFRYTPPSPETIDERAVVIDLVDGDKHYRIGIPKGMVSSNTESTLARTGPGLLPITFGALGEDGQDPWFFDTDDPAFVLGS